ncbi:hypothetical protein [Mesorhizobium sp. B4-1-3]|uniref:hypothetical protein n=1 Tax=Mesorhizobium sp. B4-1-3 TaxID=2589889 RepID=UPI0015E33D36|nr:hypothetical protein [Mesorhizobium sp. B4-1-3]
MGPEPQAVVAKAVRRLIRTEANRRALRKLLGLELIDQSLTNQEVSLLEELERAQQAD